MHGCADMYLRLDSGIGAAGILKLVRKVQRELECGSDVFAGRQLPPKGAYDLIQHEIMRLFRQAPTAGTRSAPAAKLGNKVVESCAMKREPAASRKASDPALGGDAEAHTMRRRRRWRNWWDQNLSTSAAQPQSRLATAPPSPL